MRETVLVPVAWPGAAAVVRVRAGALEPTKRRFPCDDGTGRLPRLFVAMSLQVLAFSLTAGRRPPLSASSCRPLPYGNVNGLARDGVLPRQLTCD